MKRKSLNNDASKPYSTTATAGIVQDFSPQLSAERIAVETLYQARNEQNPDLVDAVLAPNWDPLAPDQEPDPAGIKPIIRSVTAAFPDVRIAIHDMVQEPGKIGVSAEISGTHLGELFGIAPTGKKVSFRLHGSTRSRTA